LTLQSQPHFQVRHSHFAPFEGRCAKRNAVLVKYDTECGPTLQTICLMH